MRGLRSPLLYSLLAAFGLGLAGLAGGCSDETRQTGTMVPVDAEKQKIGQNKMMEYMQRKSKGEVPGTAKSKAK